MMLPMAILDIDAIAVAYNSDGEIMDEISNWQTVENYAMHEFDCVHIVALHGDPYSSFYYDRETLQAMIDRNFSLRRDCFGF